MDVQVEIDNNILKKHAELLAASDNVESYMFFTDPHWGHGKDGWREAVTDGTSRIKAIYESVPNSFVVCGGDWLGSSDTPAVACEKLDHIYNITKKTMDNFYHTLGNHDTNYQGSITEGADPWTSGPLDTDTIINHLFKDIGRMYYRFDGKLSSNYVLDTQLDSNNYSMTPYMKDELHWFANDLIENTALHINIFAHIIHINGEYQLSAMATKLEKIIEAYNKKSFIVYDGVKYDFKNTTGNIDVVISGHWHSDYVGNIGGVPSVMSTAYGTADLCIADYDNNKLYMLRVGSGASRVIDF